MNGIIICAGKDSLQNFKPEEKDFVIAADGGYPFCLQHEIHVDLFIGDCDSYFQSEFPEEKRIVPSKKDDTDTMLCIKELSKKNLKNIYIFNSIEGERIDHLFANIQSLYYIYKQGQKGFLIGENQVIELLTEKEMIHFSKKQRDGFLSLFCYVEKGALELKGFLYEGSFPCIKNDFPLAVSNEFIGNDATIEIKEGLFICVYPREVFDNGYRF